MCGARVFKQISNRQCLFIYIAIFIIVFFHAFGNGEIISPIRQGQLLGGVFPGIESRTENMKFLDYTTFVIPEADAFLNGQRSGWITTWMPYNELGRPTLHMSGLSVAYFPNWIISKFTKDPFVYATSIAILSTFLAGFFIFLVACELEFVPVASLVAALAVGLSPSLIYWVTFPMFASAYGWTAAALYGLVRFIRYRDGLGWVTVAFAIYSLLMTSYPVMVVYHAYLAIGFFIYLYFRHPDFPRDWRQLAILLIGLISAFIFGIFAALPALADTFITTAQSARMHVDVDFLRVSIPPMENFSDISKFLAFWTYPQVFGDPMAAGFPSTFNGRSFAPFVIFLVCASPWRRTWGWWVATILLVAMDTFKPIFAFGVSYLGLGLSRSVPTVHIILPMAMIAAITMDSMFRVNTSATQNISLNASKIGMTRLLFASLAYLILLANAIMVAWQSKIDINYSAVVAILIYLPLFLMCVWFRLSSIMFLIITINLMLFDKHQLLFQPRRDIVQSSLVVEKLKKLLVNGNRYAVLDSVGGFLPSNMNAQMKLSSIHSYDSLSPIRYQKLMRRLGGDNLAYGRSNNFIKSSEIESMDFILSNIGALVTREPLASPAVILEGNFDGLLVYRYIDKSNAYSRFKMSDVHFHGPDAILDKTSIMDVNSVTKVVDKGDEMQFHLERSYSAPSLLVISQSYNADWKADVQQHGQWIPLQTIHVNDAFEGIEVPQDAEFIRIRFRPWIRWSWIGHIAFSAVFLLLVGNWIRSRFRRTVGAI